WTLDMILEEHAFLNELYGREIPVIPPLKFEGQTLFTFPAPSPIPYALFPKKGGRALDEFDKDTWLELGRLIGRVHIAGAKHEKSSRITWRPDIATKHHLELLYSTDYLLPDFKNTFHSIAQQFIQKAAPKFDHQEFILLHGDCHKGNLIHRPNEGIFMIDFDDICFGPPAQDLWMLLPDKPENCEKELDLLLKGYELFRDFPRQSLGLISILRGMRIIHYVSWLAIQSGEADFQKHFPRAGTNRYWNELIKDLQEITLQIY
ncbi:MAG: serine/threonine protein kinase, partial [Candidatus Margulisbacteria bacterium]|nr:serine/threonine protein kinase [Candidatus Margulisiibacteriota bacterium]